MSVSCSTVSEVKRCEEAAEEAGDREVQVPVAGMPRGGKRWDPRKLFLQGLVLVRKAARLNEAV